MKTKAQTIAAIRAIGRELTVRCADGEWRVSFGVPAIQLVNGCTYAEAKQRNEDVAYYTGDAEDAVGTAQAMHALFVKIARI